MMKGMAKKLACFMLGFWLVFALALNAYAADVTLKWDSAAGADGYKLEQAASPYGPWQEATDADGIDSDTVATILNVPDTGVTYFRVGAYNAQGQTINYKGLAAYCADCGPPDAATGAGISNP